MARRGRDQRRQVAARSHYVRGHEPVTPTSAHWVPLLLALGAAVASLIYVTALMVPYVVPTFGPEWLTVDLDAVLPPPPAPGLLGAFQFAVAILPAIAFSVGYFAAGATRRLFVSVAFAAIFGVQLVIYTAAVFWVTGAGRPAGAIVGILDDGSNSMYLAASFGLVAGFAAAAIMTYFEARTTFPQQFDEYFEAGDAVVTSRPLPLWAHSLCAVGAIAVWAMIVAVPSMVLASGELVGKWDLASVEPWPVPLLMNDYFEVTQALAGGTVGVIAAVVLSSLVKKVLYRTVIRSVTGRDVAHSSFWIAMQSVQHVPFALAGGAATLATINLRPVFDNYDGYSVASFWMWWVAGVAAALGILLLSNVWRSGDDPLTDVPIQQARIRDVTSLAPSRRRGSRTRRRSPD